MDLDLLGENILEACQQKNIDGITSLLVDFPNLQELSETQFEKLVGTSLDTCILDNFTEGLKLLLAKLPKCMKSKVIIIS